MNNLQNDIEQTLRCLNSQKDSGSVYYIDNRYVNRVELIEILKIKLSQLIEREYPNGF